MLCDSELICELMGFLKAAGGINWREVYYGYWLVIESGLEMCFLYILWRCGNIVYTHDTI